MNILCQLTQINDDKVVCVISAEKKISLSFMQNLKKKKTYVVAGNQDIVQFFRHIMMI